MAQYYQIQNLDDLKQIYADVQVVHVASEDVGAGTHNRSQQLLLPDDQLMLNDGQQVVYQTTSVPTQQPYQQQSTTSTTQYIVGDEMSQQQQHQQQAVQHQQQVMYDHHQQQQQHYVHEPQQMQQEHQLAQQTQQQPQLYYTTEQILQPTNSMVQQQQQEMQHQQQQQQLHVQQQQYQQQQQQIVHQQHTMQAPQQPQQIVYRMQAQQPQAQQTQMLNNAHVILQQPSGQQVLIQSPQHSDIIMRQQIPQQRIIYNTNRVLYTPQHQQQQPQAQTVLQQSPSSHQQQPQQQQQQPPQQQNIQLQASTNPTANPMNARLVQTRVSVSPQETVQHQQPPTPQNVVFHPIQGTTVQNPPQLKPQLQQQPQMQIQQQVQQHLAATTMGGGVTGGGVMRGAIRNKSPRGGPAHGASHTLIARLPGSAVGRPVRPSVATAIQPQHQQPARATRPRGGAGGCSRARGATRGGRGAAALAARNPQVPVTMGQQQQQTQQLPLQQQATPSQQLLQSAMVQGKSITIVNPQGQVRQIYRVGDTHQQQLQLVAGSTHQQQRTTHLVGARFRTPIMASTGSGAANSGTTNSASNSSGNYELDLEDSIQAVVVKKDQQKPPVSTANITNPVGTTLTSYYAKEEDDTRLVRTQNGTCITLAEYRKRHPPIAGSPTTTTAAILQMKTPLRASGPQPTNKMLSTHVSGNSGMVPVARVAPQQVQPPHQPQIPITTTTSSSAVHRTSHNNYEIHTQHVMQNRNNTQMAEKDRNSAKMLVILVSGEQRLITFTLPRESCTVQDLLEQVGVPFDSSTTIQCVENPGANIDFVVTVGFSVQESASELISRAEQTLQMNRQQDPTSGNNLAATNAASVSSGGANANVSQTTTTAANFGNLASSTAQTSNSAVVTEATNKDGNSNNAASIGINIKATTPTTATEEVPRKIIQGFLAVCQSCGFSGYDHAKCERCKRVFLEPPKRVPCVKSLANSTSSTTSETSLPKVIASSELTSSDKRRGSDMLARAQTKNALSTYSSGVSGSTSSRGRGGMGGAVRGRSTRSGRRHAEIEPVILTLSSDEDDDDESSNKAPGSLSSNSNTANSLGPKIQGQAYEPLSFEPSMPEVDENMVYADFQRDNVTDLSNCTDKLTTDLQCKVVRIGTYRFEPKEPVTFTSKGICLVAPLVTNANESFPLHIHKREVVKIIAHFSKVSESMLCFYTLRNCAQYIKTSLQMKDTGTPQDGAAYFSPNGPYQVRKIILQFSACSDQSRNVIKSIWDFFDEISDVDAQDLLQRAEAADRQIANKTNEPATTTAITTTQLNPNEIRQLLIYPPGKGGISINTEDYLCLATDQYLNDIIIDFYLKWVHNNVVPQTQRERAFIFSTFFYKRLTTLTRHHHNVDKDVKQTAAQKRHARVQNWTKNVNLFEKDFIIIPINEQSHWFLAIICFPKLKGPVTFDTNIPVEPQQLKKQKGKKVSLQIGNTTITPLSKRDGCNMLAEVCGVGDDDSERDEAEGDESDLASEDSDFDSGAGATVPSNTTASATALSGNNSSPINNSTGAGPKSQAIKQPLILIFDSLAGASRSRVVATLRDYLSCEYRAKMPDVTPHVFNKDNMPGHCAKVPQQNNFTDCGLYLLQYVEHFFKDPIKDYRLPIKQLSNWFDTLTVTRKREEISQLLQQLMNERNGPNHQVILPEIPLPTLNGQLVEPPEGFNIEFEEEEAGDDVQEDDDDNTASTSADGIGNDAEGTSSSAHTEELVGAKVPTNKSVTTTALVPTQGRKIVVKRRMQLVNATVGSNISESLTTATSSATGAQSIRSGNQSKYRKFE